LEIPYYTWDLAAQFKEHVVDDFLAEYAAGRTPNPCMRCNERIKFAAVLERALALGFDAVCTGHYARLVRNGADVELHRAVDPDKDQSYVLAVLDQRQLRHSMFPLGGSPKSQVRAEAAQRGILVADKPDSHDICFIADGDTRGFLAAHLGERPGQVVAESGEVLGEHNGAFAFTVGQRRGLGLTVASPERDPRYVLSVEPVSNTVTVGPRSSLEVGTIHAGPPTWCGSALAGSRRLHVQFRAHGDAVAADINATHDGVRADLLTTVTGVAPGQTLAIYQGSHVRGSATIHSTASTEG
jgi:tRNA-specific 2-thiouridylase